MAQTQINGGTQIKTGTIPLSALVSGYSIPTANLAQGSLFIQSGGGVSMTASLNLGSNTIVSVASPVNATDAANKAYVDAKTGGIGGIHDVRILSAANISSLSGLSSIDSVTPVAGDLILCTAQSTASQNGPWVAASGAWARPSWWASGAVVNEGQYFMVAEGTTYKDTKWWCTTTGTITVDTTSTTFVQDSSGTTYTNGAGLNLVGSTFSVIYGTTSNTAAQGNDSRITGALQTSALGTNVQTALGVAVGTAGAFVVNGGVLGTPSSGTLTNCGSLPISGIASLGTGVASALAATTNAGSGLLTLSSGYVAAANFPALTGDVTNTAGSLSTTVNNTASTGFTKYTNFIIGEVPSGTINGSNAAFSLANTPATVNGSSSSVELYLNGVLLQAGSGNDYTISTSSITMLLVPQTGDKLIANYMK